MCRHRGHSPRAAHTDAFEQGKLGIDGNFGVVLGGAANEWQYRGAASVAGDAWRAARRPQTVRYRRGDQPEAEEVSEQREE